MDQAQTIYSSGTVLLLAVLLAICLLAAVWLLIRLLSAQKKQAMLEEKHHALELAVQAQELQSIQYKLNPHLFKNTLNSIQSHAYQTYYALDKLSNVLDYILYESDVQFVSLKEEVEFALNLIEINRLKVSPLFDLRVKNRINTAHPLYEQQLVAPLITIDLIENAFKHADLQREDAFISVVFEFSGDVFSLTVSNKISPKPALKKEKSGFGRDSLKKRLAAIYQGNYKLDQFTEGDVYISHLKINLFEHKNKMLAT